MKVILEAFGGKLRSEPMDWPDDYRGRPEIRMMLDLDRLKTVWVGEYQTIPDNPIMKQGRFMLTSRSEVHGKHTADVYVLVDIC